MYECMPTKHITITEEEDAVLKKHAASPTSLFRAAINQLRFGDLFLDPNAPHDITYLLKEIEKLRAGMQAMQECINNLQTSSKNDNHNN